ncbi:MAG: trimeric intracellular cation channel family protein [Pseudomonadota bacterium]
MTLGGAGSLIDAVGMFGVVVFAISGALAAGRLRLDPVGFVLLGTVTAIGGGTLRDLLLGRPVFWVEEPGQLVLSVAAALTVYLFLKPTVARDRWLAWSDAAGLAAFAVQGSLIALAVGVSPLVAVVMGVMTATGGGVIRDLLAGDRPMIFRGQLYASTALAGATAVVGLSLWGAEEDVAAAIGFATTFLTRGATLLFDIRMGPPGEFLRIGKADD